MFFYVMPRQSVSNHCLESMGDTRVVSFGPRAPVLALDVCRHLFALGGGVATLKAAVAPPGVLP